MKDIYNLKIKTGTFKGEYLVQFAHNVLEGSGYKGYNYWDAWICVIVAHGKGVYSGTALRNTDTDSNNEDYAKRLSFKRAITALINDKNLDLISGGEELQRLYKRIWINPVLSEFREAIWMYDGLDKENENGKTIQES